MWRQPECLKFETWAMDDSAAKELVGRVSSSCPAVPNARLGSASQKAEEARVVPSSSTAVLAQAAPQLLTIWRPGYSGPAM